MNPMPDERGFGLSEAIVSLVILGVMLAAMIPAFASNIAFNTTSQARTGAVAVAQETMDNLRAVGEDWPASGTEREIDTASGTYTTRLVHEQFCEEELCFDGARRVSVTVSWNGRHLYEVETVFTALDPAGL